MRNLFYDKQVFYAPTIFILLITLLYYIPISAQGISALAPNPPTDNSAGLLYLLIFVSVIVVLYKLTHRKRKRAANVDVSNAHSIFHTFVISVSGGLAMGFLAGFVRTR